MKFSYFNTVLFVALFCICLVAVSLRMFRLDKFNQIIADERTWVLNGTSLIKENMPESWTIFWSSYTDLTYINRDSESTLVVKPYLDHPPAFAYLIGFWALNTQNNLEYSWDWKILRIPMIGISFLLIIALSYFVKSISNTKLGFLVFVSLAALPSHILTSRIITPENLISLLLLIMLILLKNYKRENPNSVIYFIAILMLAWTAPLLKLNGIIVPATAIVYFFYKKYYSETVSIFAAIIFSFSTYALYGCHYDCKIFWNILSEHSKRPQTFWYFFSIFGAPNLGYYELKDPMVVTGLIGLIASGLEFSSVNNTKVTNKTVWIDLSFIISAIVPVALILLLVAPIELYGWYKYLIFPFCAVGLSLIWNNLLEKKIGWMFLIIPANLVLIEDVFSLSSLTRKIAVLIVVLPLVILFFKRNLSNTKFYTMYVYSLFIFTTVLEFIYSYKLLSAL